MELEQAKNIIEAEKKQRCQEASEKLEEIMKEYKVMFIPCVTIFDNVVDVEKLINAQVGFRVVSK